MGEPAKQQFELRALKGENVGCLFGSFLIGIGLVAETLVVASAVWLTHGFVWSALFLLATLVLTTAIVLWLAQLLRPTRIVIQQDGLWLGERWLDQTEVLDCTLETTFLYRLVVVCRGHTWRSLPLADDEPYLRSVAEAIRAIVHDREDNG